MSNVKPIFDQFDICMWVASAHGRSTEAAMAAMERRGGNAARGVLPEVRSSGEHSMICPPNKTNMTPAGECSCCGPFRELHHLLMLWGRPGTEWRRRWQHLALQSSCKSTGRTLGCGVFSCFSSRKGSMTRTGKPPTLGLSSWRIHKRNDPCISHMRLSCHTLASLCPRCSSSMPPIPHCPSPPPLFDRPLS